MSQKRRLSSRSSGSSTSATFSVNSSLMSSSGSNTSGSGKSKLRRIKRKRPRKGSSSNASASLGKAKVSRGKENSVDDEQEMGPNAVSWRRSPSKARRVSLGSLDGEAVSQKEIQQLKGMLQHVSDDPDTDARTQRMPSDDDAADKERRALLSSWLTSSDADSQQQMLPHQPNRSPSSDESTSGGGGEGLMDILSKLEDTDFDAIASKARAPTQKAACYTQRGGAKKMSSVTLKDRMRMNRQRALQLQKLRKKQRQKKQAESSGRGNIHKMLAKERRKRSCARPPPLPRPPPLRQQPAMPPKAKTNNNAKRTAAAAAIVDIEDDDFFAQACEMATRAEELSRKRKEKTLIAADSATLFSASSRPSPETFARFIVESVSDVPGSYAEAQKKLLLHSARLGITCVAVLRESWYDTIVVAGDMINVVWTGSTVPLEPSSDHRSAIERLKVLCSSAVVVDDANHFVIVHPDYLVSPTRVADASGCLRRAVIGAMCSSSSPSRATVTGNMKHELFEKALIMAKEASSDPAIGFSERALMSTLTVSFAIPQSSRTCLQLE